MKRNWNNIWKGMATVLIVGYVVFSLFSFSYSSESLTCNFCKVSILDSTTLRFVTKQDVIRFIDDAKLNPMGVRVENINMTMIEETLEKKSRIKTAECYMTPSGIMCIDITQREPIMRVMGRDDYYIDSEGGIMEKSDNFAAYVPVVTGHVSREYAKSELYDFAMFLKQDRFWNAFIEQIDVNSGKELTLVPRVGSQNIILGTLDDYQGKLAKLKTLYQRGFSKTGWNYYKTINLSYKNQVVCTKKE